jgi:hypothetical protein
MNSMHEWCSKCGSARKHQLKFHHSFLGSQPQLRTQLAICKLTTGLLRHCWEGEENNNNYNHHYYYYYYYYMTTKQKLCNICPMSQHKPPHTIHWWFWMRCLVTILVYDPHIHFNLPHVTFTYRENKQNTEQTLYGGRAKGSHYYSSHHCIPHKAVTVITILLITRAHKVITLKGYCVVLIESHRRFRTVCQSNLQGSSSWRLCNIPEEWRPHLYHGRSLKPWIGAHIGKCGSVTTVARLEVLTVVIMKFQVFWYVTLCILIVTNISLFLHYLSMEMEALNSIKMSLHI